jgi:hypothetical protein
MDDATLADLRKALGETPGNLRLRLVVVRALSDRDDRAAAADLVDALDPAALAAEERLLAARALLRAGRAERALAFAPGGAEGAVVAARALLELGRVAEAAERYRGAVAESPAL